MTVEVGSKGHPLPSALSLVGRRVVVTGAASGIGRATARAAGELGATVILNDRTPLTDIHSALAEDGLQVESVEGDLTQSDMIDQLIAKGPIAGVAHCAGILNRVALHEDPDPRARFHETMDVNVRVPIDLGIAFTDHMADHGGGAIVMIGSVAGRTGGTSLSTPLDYAASKGAVHTVVRWLSRRAVGRGVMINGIAPGPIDTPMTAGSTINAEQLPTGRKGRPEEIAWMAMMLLTPAAAYVSGAILDCNGGAYVG